MNKLLTMLLIVSAVFITSCASVAPTRETYTGYRIYHVSNDYTLTQVKNAIEDAAKEVSDDAQVTNSIPPYPLPEKPGRFQMKEMVFGPFTMQFPQTPGATISVRSNRGDSAGGTSMNWVVGVYPYKDGYSVQIVMTASYERGTSNFLDPNALGQALGRMAVDATVGGAEEQNKKWFDTFSEKINANVKMQLEESYPQS